MIVLLSVAASIGKCLFLSRVAKLFFYTTQTMHNNGFKWLSLRLYRSWFYWTIWYVWTFGTFTLYLGKLGSCNLIILIFPGSYIYIYLIYVLEPRYLSILSRNVWVCWCSSHSHYLRDYPVPGPGGRGGQYIHSGTDLPKGAEVYYFIHFLY